MANSVLWCDVAVIQQLSTHRSCQWSTSINHAQKREHTPPPRIHMNTHNRKHMPAHTPKMSGGNGKLYLKTLNFIQPNHHCFLNECAIICNWWTKISSPNHPSIHRWENTNFYCVSSMERTMYVQKCRKFYEPITFIISIMGNGLEKWYYNILAACVRWYTVCLREVTRSEW